MRFLLYIIRLIMKLINTRQMNKDDIEEARREIQVRHLFSSIIRINGLIDAMQQAENQCTF